MLSLHFRYQPKIINNRIVNLFINTQNYSNFQLRLGLTLIFSALIIFNKANSQPCRVQFSGATEDVTLFNKYFEQPICDTARLKGHLDKTLMTLQGRGYLLANYALKSIDTSQVNADVFAGPKYKWASLSAGNTPEIILSKIGFRERFYNDKPFKIQELDKLIRKIVAYGEQEGYPFLSVKLDSIKVYENEISAALNVNQGVLINYDSIKVVSDFSIKNQWLASYLNVKFGDFYNQSSVDNISYKIDQLNFMKMKEPPVITFQNEEATINLNVERNPNNRIDGIVGFLPNEEEQGRILITGEFDLSLNNLFNSGKELNVKWQSLKARSQFLNIDYYHRNLFRSPLHLSSSLEILKEDTLFINRQGEVSFNFTPSKHGVELFTKLRSSRLLSTEQFREAPELPEVIDFNLDYYGLLYNYNVNRLSGAGKKYFSMQVEASVGSKRIRRNNGIPAELYDDINLRSIQYNLNGAFEFHIPFSKNFIFFHRSSAGKIINQALFLNDLYRIGGLETLRGFNENFFFASDYLLSNLELRLYFQSSSYLFAFYDQSYLYYDIQSSSFEDYPLGIGLGINIATKSGLVSLAYGLGRSDDQPLSLNLSKFHFGYVTKF